MNTRKTDNTCDAPDCQNQACIEARTAALVKAFLIEIRKPS